MSLNASIEATRAGEMGKGFTVVASEIKKLADESIISSHEIGEIVTEIQGQVDNTSEAITLTLETIISQNNSVQSTSDVFNDISSSISEMYNQLKVCKEGTDKPEPIRLWHRDPFCGVS